MNIRLHSLLPIATMVATISVSAMASDHSFSIAEQSLETALQDFAKQGGLQMVFVSSVSEGLKAKAIVGTYDDRYVLSTLLEGSGLAFEYIDDHTVVIKNDSGDTGAQSGGQDTSAPPTLSQRDRILEEVVVTATKRTERLQDVPLAISALTTDDIREQGIENFDDFARQIPGVNLNDATKNIGNFVIRGIATNVAAGAGNQNSVTVYLDELPITNSSAVTPDIRLFDIERVEVLRGPQGTLFGSGSLAGAVRVITNKADPEHFESNVSMDFGVQGSDSFRQRYNGMVNIPLIDSKLAMRLVGYARDEDGYVDNIGLGVDKSNGNKDWGARGSLRWLPTDRLTTTFTVIHDEAEPEDFSMEDPNLGLHKRSTFVPDLTTSILTSYNLTLEYEFDWATLTSSTTQLNSEVEFQQDFSRAVFDIFPFSFWAIGGDGSTLVEEVRLVSSGESSLEWVVGGFFMDLESKGPWGFNSDPEFVQGINITGLPDSQQLSYSYARSKSREKALFGELSYNFSESFKITGGLRYANYKATSETLAGGFNVIGDFFGAVLGGGNVNISPTALPGSTVIPYEDNKLTKKVSLTWMPNDQQTYYAVISEGYRNGLTNANAGSSSFTDPNDPFIIPDFAKPDSVMNYEVGVKAYWLDGRLKTNLSVYYIDWKDIQFEARRVSDTTVFFSNAGKAVSKGIELELQASPTDALELGLNLTVQSAKITSISDEDAATSGAVEGHHLPSPDLQIAGYAKYTWQLNNGQEIYARLDAQYVGDYLNGLPNNPGQPGVPNPAIERTSSYENINMSVAWLMDQWSAMLYVENLLDNDDYIQIYPNSSFTSRYTTLPPRTVGLRINRNF